MMAFLLKCSLSIFWALAFNLYRNKALTKDHSLTVKTLTTSEFTDCLYLLFFSSKMDAKLNFMSESIHICYTYLAIGAKRIDIFRFNMWQK